MAEVHIVCYFSVVTDLAALLRSWPEFKAGSGYNVELSNSDGSERVSVEFVESEGDESDYVRVASAAGGELFARVLGSTIYALAAHSDNLMVDRRD